jgi:glycosyltransferase involved in cell wall biosynthesis
LRWVRQTRFCQSIHFQEYTPWLAPYHFRLLKRWGKYLFHTVHGIYPHKYLPGVPKVLFDYWNKTAWRKCDALFVHTEGLRNRLSHFLGAEHPPIFVTPFGLWNFPPDLATRSIFEERKQNQNLLFFGVIRPNKGLHVLLRAMKELPDFTLTIAGEFKEVGYKKQIQKLMNRLPSYQIKIIDRFIKMMKSPSFLKKTV